MWTPPGESWVALVASLTFPGLLARTGWAQVQAEVQEAPTHGRSLMNVPVGRAAHSPARASSPACLSVSVTTGLTCSITADAPSWVHRVHSTNEQWMNQATWPDPRALLTRCPSPSLS